MAKKTTTIVEEDITPEEKALKEHDEAVLDALDSKDESLTIDPENMDETPKEEVKEEPKEEIKEEPKPAEPAEPIIDKEALKEELKEEVIKEVQALKEEQTPDQKDEYDKFVEDYTSKNGKAPEWKQVASFLKDQAKQELKAELDAEVKEEEKQEEETKLARETQQQQLNQSLNADWEDQLNDLVTSGKIPAVKDPDNNEVKIITDESGKELERIPVEEGKRARYELFKAMYVASADRVDKGAKPLTNLKEIYYEHYSKDKQPAGANAPIAGVRKSVSSGNDKSFSYNEIHNTGWEDLLKQS